MNYKINSQGGVYQPGKPIPLHVRNRIADLFTEGETYSGIARRMKIHTASVRRIISKYVNTGTFSPSKSSGRKRTICSNEITQFIEYLKFSQPSITRGVNHFKKSVRDFQKSGHFFLGLSDFLRLLPDFFSRFFL